MVERVFDHSGMAVQSPLAEVAAAARPGGRGPEPGPLPVLPPLRGLLPGLWRGQVVAVDGPGALPLALVAGAVTAGGPTAVMGCRVVGRPVVHVRHTVGCGVDRL